MLYSNALKLVVSISCADCADMASGRRNSAVAAKMILFPVLISVSCTFHYGLDNIPVACGNVDVR